MLRPLAGLHLQLGQVLCRADQAVPVFVDVLGGAADLCHDLGHLFGRHHFDGVPRADGEIVGVGLLARDVDAHFAAHATLEIDLAEALHVGHAGELLDLHDAVDRADLETGFATGAVVGVDDRQLLGELLAGALLGHAS